MHFEIQHFLEGGAYFVQSVDGATFITGYYLRPGAY